MRSIGMVQPDDMITLILRDGEIVNIIYGDHPHIELRAKLVG